MFLVDAGDSRMAREMGEAVMKQVFGVWAGASRAERV